MDSVSEETGDMVSRQPMDSIPVTSADYNVSHLETTEDSFPSALCLVNASASQIQTQATERDNSESVDQHACHALCRQHFNLVVHLNECAWRQFTCHRKQPTPCFYSRKNGTWNIDSISISTSSEASSSYVINTVPQ